MQGGKRYAVLLVMNARGHKGLFGLAHLRALLRLALSAGHPQIASSDSGFPAVRVLSSAGKPHRTSHLHSNATFLWSPRAATQPLVAGSGRASEHSDYFAVGLRPTVPIATSRGPTSHDRMGPPGNSSWPFHSRIASSTKPADGHWCVIRAILCCFLGQAGVACPKIGANIGHIRGRRESSGSRFRK